MASAIKDDTQHGPRYHAGKRDLVTPDLLVCTSDGLFEGDGKTLWAEVKTKSVFTWHRISHEWLTGIDYPYYVAYQQVAEHSGLPVWLMFLHTQSRPSKSDLQYPSCPRECPAGLYGQALSFLMRNEHHRYPRQPLHEMVYWAESSLVKFCEKDELGDFLNGESK